MEVRVLATGSKANCYVLKSGEETLLLDAGLNYLKTFGELDYRLPDYLLVTHEHSDHSRGAKEFLNRGVEVLMTEGTAFKLKMERHNLHKVKVGDEVQLGLFKVNVIPSKHDAAEPVNFIVTDSADRLLYLTDTGSVPALEGDFTKILIEANHTRWAVLNSEIPRSMRYRILGNHLAVDKAFSFIKKYPSAEVWLIHVSRQHGDAKKFKELFQGIRDSPVHIWGA